MEARISLVFDNLEKVMGDTQRMCELVETEPISLQELLKKKYLLKRSLDQVVSDIHKCIDQGLVSPDLITRGTKLQLSAEEALATIEAVAAVSQAHFKNNNTEYDKAENNSKLPKIELPKFSGDLLKWHEFWDRFESTVHKRNISEADKLAYLIGCLEGHALKFVEGLATTNSNYNIALNTLQTRYGKTDLLIDAHYKALYDLPPASGIPSDCRNTLNSIERHLRILSSLGEQIDSNHLRITLLQKFPDSIVYEVNLATRDSTVKSLRSNLEHIITAKERSFCVTQIWKPETQVSRPAQASTSEALLNVNPDFKYRPKKNPMQYKRNQTMNRKRKAVNNYDSKQKRKRLACIFCNGDHYNSECVEFKTVTDRKKKLGKKCYRCFKEGHNNKDCKLKRTCFYCKERDHNQALCPGKGKNETHINNVQELSSTCYDSSFLQTAVAMARNHNNEVLCRLLLDSGSQRSYITKHTANKLNLIPDSEDYLVIYTFGSNKPRETCSPTTEITIETKRGIKRKMRVNIVPYIIEKINGPNLNIKNIADIVADDGELGNRIDILIGNDYYFTFIRTQKINIRDNLFIVDSEFGWIVTGTINSAEKDRENTLSVVTYCKCDESHFPYFTEPDLPLRDMDIKFLWALESIGITDSTKTTREEEAIQHFNSTVKYDNQRYQVKWPWIQYPPELPTNYHLAMGRLANLARRLDLKMLEEYDLILHEQLKNGVIEIIEPSADDFNGRTPPVHYLPHHIIKQDGKRSRIVYDASARTKTQRSLNECMYRGPSMIEDLNALLLSFRTYKVAITADVEKAFLQIGLQTEDRDVTRFLWVKDLTGGITEGNIQHLRFCRVPFGIISSPFLLTATIRYHLSKRDDNLIKEMANKCYVDNLVTGTSSTEKAKELYQKFRNVFQELSMNIREWVSNDQNFLRSVPKIHQAKNTENVKVLGLCWNVEDDTLRIKVKENIFRDDASNKRDVLRKIASFFDPCGFASPLILPAKLLMQELWLRKLNWSSPLPEDLKEKWSSIIENLQGIKDMEIPRYIGCGIEINEETRFELHCFTDASEKAYAAVTYLRIIGPSTKTVFIMSKSRVTPIKQKENLKIPRLELLGYTIGNHLLSYINKSLELPISRQYLWTDSTIVLCWMRSNKLLDPFVTRRVNEIKQNKNTEWRYVNSSENPADIATRPGTWNHKTELWLYGPDFLSQDESSWPRVCEDKTFCAVVGEALLTTFPEERELDEELEVHTTIPDNGTENITSDNRKLKKLQSQHFPEEVSGKQTNLSRNLQLFMDVDGLLRCQGRMAHTTWEYDKKHPVLIPNDCKFTDQLIMDTHEKNYHVGVSHTLSIIRQHYWIPKGRSQVQKILRKCQRCVKQGGGPYSLPPMPDLPPERVNYNAPFTYTGIDYFGPLYVQTAIGKEKRWVCLMTCLAVRAVHMEIVADLTTQECLQALRRFIASRGMPAMIVSDNALQFKLSAEILENSYCIQNKIKWKFIPQLAPWHGGFYERLIGLVKHCLRRTLDKHLLTDCQLLTVIKEIEAVMNTRPLTYVGPEPEFVLKPADFLTMGKCIVTEPANNICTDATVTKQDIIEGWKKGNVILEEYKKMFVNQYLLGLRERYNHGVKQPRIKSGRTPMVGDIVQIKGDSKNRDMWKVGKIVSLIKGTDGECRVAKVKSADSELIRSLGHLYPLEMEEAESELTTVEPVRNLEFQQERPTEQLYHTDQNDSLIDIRRIDLHSEAPEPLIHIDDKDMNTEASQKEQTVVDQSPQIQVETIDEQQNEDTNINLGEDENVGEVRGKREAAVKAREKIAEWTRHLAVALFAVGSVAKERDPQ